MSQTFQKTSFQAATWDRLYSTFHWTMYLDPDKNKVPTMPGYSKKQGFNESPDKIAMLQSILVRLGSQGYFNRIMHIEFFQRTGPIINKPTDKHIFTMYPNGDAKFHDHELFKNADLIHFFQKLGKCIRGGEPLTHLVAERKKAYSQDEFFDVSKHHFKTINQLNAYCTKMVSNNNPFGQVTNFYNKYLEQNPTLLQHGKQN